ncbi:MAG: serine acetyltransferase [Candidatus Electrothrix sp. AW5]|nr:serine acetyltransferase [Candidatus Electrothrix gigas]
MIDIIYSDIERLYSIIGKQPPKNTLGVISSCFSPRIFPVLLLRFTLASHHNKFLFLAKLFSLINFTIFGLEVGGQCKIGAGLFLPHTQGTIIGAKRIGRNVTIHQQVTIGAKEADIAFSNDQRPVIGNNVMIGAGSKVLGNITIGNNVKIGANAVVLSSFPDNVLIAGVPARIVKQSTASHSNSNL